MCVSVSAKGGAGGGGCGSLFGAHGHVCNAVRLQKVETSQGLLKREKGRMKQDMFISSCFIQSK